MSKHSLRLCLGILIQLCLIPRSIAVIQTLGIDVICADGSCDETLFASQSNFGTFPAMTAEKNEPMFPNSPPSDDPLLCEGKTALASEFLKFGADKKFVLVVPRGSCTFEQKTVSYLCSLNTLRIALKPLACFKELFVSHELEIF